MGIQVHGRAPHPSPDGHQASLWAWLLEYFSAYILCWNCAFKGTAGSKQFYTLTDFSLKWFY